MADDDPTGRENEAADDVSVQLDSADTLLDRGLVDPLDEGYSPPDREPVVHVPTEAEEHEGLSLDELLAAEEPDVGAGDEDNLFSEYGDEVGGARAGRLVDADSGAYEDTDKDLWAGDIGIDGAGATAEEAAVHVIGGDGEGDLDD
ncbi:hypothetical protein SAMN04515671_4050 [Nakamurella panacisegetis]|uniref:DUF5709 domain-containing protein n=1 Tax=Nakamurella panacisegetis TaxID=1090615 RepID=A0A1H0SDV7_9ACTN|nr:DUF5709 domain-containing protein [Nakamurella panacisegetis]SDP39904.1 hypothetical protein SAMN04515671_4050 [Nakamurella panacisegetis]